MYEMRLSNSDVLTDHGKLKNYQEIAHIFKLKINQNENYGPHELHVYGQSEEVRCYC